jgi:hypothetical protein
LPNTTAGTNSAGYKSTSRILNDGGYHRIQLVSKSSTGTGSYQVRFTIGSSERDNIMFLMDNTNLTAYKTSGGSPGSEGTIAFVMANMDFWQFRRSGSNIIMEYGPDGSSWTTLATISSFPDVFLSAATPHIVCFEALSTGSATFDAPIIFDGYVYSKG